MASNLSTIGFHFDDNAAFSEKMIELAEATDAQALCADGHYAIWSEPSGAQLWFHVRPEGGSNGSGEPTELAILGLTPFFEGKSNVKAKITAPITRSEDNGFEGGFYAWIGPDDSGEGVYPLVFDAVDFAIHAARKVPFETGLRLSGFARELTAYKTAADFEAADGEGPKLAVQSFIPMGIFAASGAADVAGDDPTTEAANDNENGGAGDDGCDANPANGDKPSATALLTGKVIAHHKLRNENTGREFHWLSVESLEATFDILADPDVVTGEITEGGVVEVACWFFGRILD